MPRAGARPEARTREETDAQIRVLADSTYALMAQAIKPLGDLITALPAGPEYPGQTASPSFELFYESDYVLPHREAAWILLAERIEAAAAFCQPPGNGTTPEVTEKLAEVRDALAGIASPLQAHLPSRPAAAPAGPAGKQRIVVAENGPYLITNAAAVRSYLGESPRVPPQLAFCQCGESGDKPFCDGSHARAGFSGAKDPKRVPERRDTYPGGQVTIFDNRGICQHSGFCTDRLPTVLRADAEPFVAPSGGRMDEIVRAVRDCPSAATSPIGTAPASRRSRSRWTVRTG
ncbi:MAG TPA: (4Fe-4S)-binding protein [Trebonia sp.]